MIKFILAAALGFVFCSLSADAKADCSAYSSCGHKDAKYPTCEEYNDCRDREAKAREEQRNKAKGGPHAEGENKNPPKKSRHGATRAE